jgi:hypothetical protein
MKRGKRKNAPRLQTVKKLAADMRRNAELYSMANLSTGCGWMSLEEEVSARKQVGPRPF